MNKQDCLNASENAQREAEEAIKRIVTYTACFGGGDALTVAAMRERDEACDAAHMWKRIAEWHHKTRQAALIKRELPLHLFRFVL
jgi:hypothetical protein